MMALLAALFFGDELGFGDGFGQVGVVVQTGVNGLL